MKQIVVLLFAVLLNTLITAAQDSIYVTPTGFTKVQLETSLDDQTLYNRTIAWVNETYKNPDKVITGRNPGVSLNISGYSGNAWNYSSLGMQTYYSMEYTIHFSFDKGNVTFQLIEGEHRQASGGPYLGNSKSFFNGKGEYRKIYNTAKPTLENTLNTLWLSYRSKITKGELTSEEALDQLKKAKDKLELGLITQEEFDALKTKLAPFIK
jgi:hypothetical protein